MELKLNSSHQKIQQLEAHHQQDMARRSKWNRLFAGGFQLVVLGLAVMFGARQVAPGDSQYPQLPMSPLPNTRIEVLVRRSNQLSYGSRPDVIVEDRSRIGQLEPTNREQREKEERK
ncbi:hypothetical protein FOTG_15337 [Fusarium oxysporum f. sp. vasinfectum 25433]|uniref:Uncharacterized protein n=1 Tax=Fusarium oxysporum f. sp. vasinfectum 25433 TaxID=1089449 RepID=X0L5M8_FUSOX|nr:hypothetical protein FOTG_15337 [Fusarium oxysporum f. sp. vasinfectum 25433]